MSLAVSCAPPTLVLLPSHPVRAPTRRRTSACVPLSSRATSGLSPTFGQNGRSNSRAASYSPESSSLLARRQRSPARSLRVSFPSSANSGMLSMRCVRSISRLDYPYRKQINNARRERKTLLRSRRLKCLRAVSCLSSYCYLLAFDQDRDDFSSAPEVSFVRPEPLASVT